MVKKMQYAQSAGQSQYEPFPIPVFARCVRNGRHSSRPTPRGRKRKQWRNRRKKQWWRMKKESRISILCEMTPTLLTTDYLCVTLEEIRKARQKIYLFVYLANIPPGKKVNYCRKIIDTLRQKKNEGLDVKIIINGVLKSGTLKLYNRRFVSQLQKAGIPYLVYRGGKTVHSKAIIIDTTTTIMGSHNLTETAVRNNIDTSVIIRDRMFTFQIESLFFSLWERSQKVSKKSRLPLKKLIYTC